jgi:hypothetical protein
MKRRGKRKNYPKRHKFSINDKVIFVFAGSKRIGWVIERTWEEVGIDPKGHATYVIASGDKIYPCVGVDGSKEFGNIITEDTKVGEILRNSREPTRAEGEERGYKHLSLPKLKDMCRKHKLKVGGNKKALVERLEQKYKQDNEFAII